MPPLLQLKKLMPTFQHLDTSDGCVPPYCYERCLSSDTKIKIIRISRHLGMIFTHLYKNDSCVPTPYCEPVWPSSKALAGK